MRALTLRNARHFIFRGVDFQEPRWKKLRKWIKDDLAWKDLELTIIDANKGILARRREDEREYREARQRLSYIEWACANPAEADNGRRVLAEGGDLYHLFFRELEKRGVQWDQKGEPLSFVLARPAGELSGIARDILETSWPAWERKSHPGRPRLQKRRGRQQERGTQTEIILLFDAWAGRHRRHLKITWGEPDGEHIEAARLIHLIIEAAELGRLAGQSITLDAVRRRTLDAVRRRALDAVRRRALDDFRRRREELQRRLDEFKQRLDEFQRRKPANDGL